MADTTDPQAPASAPADTPAPTPPAPVPAPAEPEAPPPAGQEPISEGEAEALFAQIAAEAEAADAPQRRTLRARRGKNEPVEASGDDDAPNPSPSPAPKPEPGATPAPTPSPAPAMLKPNIPTAPAPSPTGFTPEEMEALRNLPNVIKAMGGRMSQMQSALEKGNAAAAAAGADTPTAKDVAAAGKDSSKWKKLKEDFPEWAEAVEERIGETAAPLPAPANEAFEQRLSAAEAKANAATEELAVVVRHGPHWREKLRTPAFINWYNSQTEAERTRIYTVRSSQDIIGVLDSFDKAHPQSTSSVPASPAAAARGQSPADPELAAAVTQRGARSAPKRTVDDITDEKELWNHFAREADSA